MRDVVRADDGNRLIILAGTGDRAIAAMVAAATRLGDDSAVALVPTAGKPARGVLQPLTMPTAAKALTEALADRLGAGTGTTVVAANTLWALPEDAITEALAPAATVGAVTLLAPLLPQRDAWAMLAARAALALCREHQPPAWGVAAGMDYRIVAHGLYYDARLTTWERALATACPEAAITVEALDGREVEGALDRLAALCDLPGADLGAADTSAAEIVGWKAVALAEEVALARPDCPRRRRIWAGALHDTAMRIARSHDGWRGDPPCRVHCDEQESLALHYRASNRALAARFPVLDFRDQPPIERVTADILSMEADEIAAARAHLNALLERHDPDWRRPLVAA